MPVPMVRGGELDCVEEMLLAELAAFLTSVEQGEIPQWVDAVAQLLNALPLTRSSLWILCVHELLSQREQVLRWSGDRLLAYRLEFWRRNMSHPFSP